MPRRRAAYENRQQMVLSFIAQNVTAKGYPPSVREIAKALGIKSTATVYKYLKSLEELGFIRRRARLPRAIEISNNTTFSVPVVGKVTAGLPILAVQNIDSRVPLPTGLLAVDQDCFILKVQGNSMIGAGIFDGDFLVVRQQHRADNGDIVVAQLGDEATVKRFYQYAQGTIKLEPENPQMEPIIAKDKDVKILGRVIGLVRSY